MPNLIGSEYVCKTAQAKLDVLGYFTRSRVALGDVSVIAVPDIIDESVITLMKMCVFACVCYSPRPTI